MSVGSTIIPCYDTFRYPELDSGSFSFKEQLDSRLRGNDEEKKLLLEL
ncbi:MAG: hypothetical protein Q8R86_02125 [Sulfuricurvum sp.]|nr:hypothetical protein [Sulfuricurvum sp.]